MRGIVISIVVVGVGEIVGAVERIEGRLEGLLGDDTPHQVRRAGGR
jgi:hypothetical protein